MRKTSRKLQKPSILSKPTPRNPTRRPSRQKRTLRRLQSRHPPNRAWLRRPDFKLKNKRRISRRLKPKLLS